MSTQRVYLVVSADRRVRVVKKLYAVGIHEVAFAVNLHFPDTWGRVVSSVDIDVPDSTPTIEVPS